MPFSHQQQSAPQQSVVRSDRRERRDDSYIHAPAEQIFDTDDSYFHSSGQRRGGGDQYDMGGVRGQGQERSQNYHYESSQSAGTRSDGVSACQVDSDQHILCIGRGSLYANSCLWSDWFDVIHVFPKKSHNCVAWVLFSVFTLG